MYIIDGIFKKLFESLISDLNIYNWYYSWTFLYGNVLSKKRELFYEKIEDSLCIYYKMNKEIRLFYPPLNGNDGILRKALTNCNNESIPYVYENYDTKYKKTKASPDYIFDLEEIVMLEGSKYKRERNSTTAFKKKYNYIFRKAEQNDKEEILKFNEIWTKQKRNNGLITWDTGYTESVIKYMLDDCISYVVKIDNKIVGYFIGCHLNKDYCCAYARKSDINYIGLSDFLFVESYKKMKDLGYKYGNDSGDVGNKGLMKFKMGYNPVKFIQNYKIEVKKQEGKIKDWI